MTITLRQKWDKHNENRVEYDFNPPRPFDVWYRDYLNDHTMKSKKIIKYLQKKDHRKLSHITYELEKSLHMPENEINEFYIKPFIKDEIIKKINEEIIFNANLTEKQLEIIKYYEGRGY